MTSIAALTVARRGAATEDAPRTSSTQTSQTSSSVLAVMKSRLASGSQAHGRKPGISIGA
jgi:hypothetical protein